MLGLHGFIAEVAEVGTVTCEKARLKLSFFDSLRRAASRSAPYYPRIAVVRGSTVKIPSVRSAPRSDLLGQTVDPFRPPAFSGMLRLSCVVLCTMQTLFSSWSDMNPPISCPKAPGLGTHHRHSWVWLDATAESVFTI